METLNAKQTNVESTASRAIRKEAGTEDPERLPGAGQSMQVEISNGYPVILPFTLDAEVMVRKLKRRLGSKK